MSVTAPTTGRPAKGFTAQRAQQWVLAAAVITAVVYTFRRISEGAVSTAPAKGGKVSALLGTGSPPPPLGQWAIAYGAGFTLLALVSVAAPELAGSLAMLELVGCVLGNGNALAGDLSKLEGNAKAKTTPAAPVSTKAETAAANTANAVAATIPTAPSTAAESVAAAAAVAAAAGSGTPAGGLRP